MKVAMATYWQF